MALSHIVLHAALCNAALRLKPESQLALHVVVSDRINRDTLDQTFHVVRENGNEAVVEFDIPWGTYRATLDMKLAHANCGAIKYFGVISDHNRVLGVSMEQGRPQNMVPALVMGTAPFAFSYVSPTVVAFDASTACNAQVSDPLDAAIVTENDEDGYYASIFLNPTLAQHYPAVVAVRLTDSHAGFHYIRVPAKILRYVGRGSWPSTVTLNANEDLIDYVADKPEDTLLCPKMYQTMAQ